MSTIRSTMEFSIHPRWLTGYPAPCPLSSYFRESHYVGGDVSRTFGLHVRILVGKKEERKEEGLEIVQQ